jgi:Flp pilus assembly pilin Flp
MSSRAIPLRDLRRAACGTARRFTACESGATAVEYGLMAAFFSATVIGASGSIKSAIEAALNTVSGALVTVRNGG